MNGNVLDITGRRFGLSTLVFTAHDAAYQSLAEITVPRMALYADKWGLDFRSFTEAPDMVNGIYWLKFVEGIKLLKEYDRIIWLDADQVITNYKVRLLFPESGFHVSKDWGHDATRYWHFSVCGFVAHKNDGDLMQAAINVGQGQPPQPFPEQGPMRAVAQLHPNRFYVHQRSTFNAVPDAVCPGKVPQPWEAGDFAAHITMLPIEDRVKLAKEIVKTL